MKSDIALQEIERIDEYEEEHAEASSVDVATQEPTAPELDRVESSVSVDIPTDTVINYDEPPTTEPEDSAVEMPVNNDETATESAALPTVPAIDDEQDTADLADLSAAENIMYDGQTSTEDPLAKRLEAIPANTVGFFEEVVATSSTFFKNNRQLLTNLGVIFVAFMVTKLAFAGLNAIDDLPLVSPLLKLVGLYYVLQFIWNYLIRQQDRQKLVEKINTTKAEVLGDRD